MPAIEKSAVKMRLKKVGVLSYAKISTVIMAIVGLFLGIFYEILNLAFGSQIASAAAAGGTQPDPLMTMGPWVILVMPVMYAIMGFIMGVIGAWLYNLIAKWVGGVEVEFEK
jgi:hypothetical protein